MFRSKSRLVCVTASVWLTALAAGPALADDTEIFRSQADSTGALPNVLFVIDTSGSMDEDEEVTPIAYNPAKTYAGSCSAGEIYYVTGSTQPSCSGNSFPASINKCSAAATVLAGTAGSWSGKAAQFRSSGGSVNWNTISNNNNSAPVECAADHGVHGETGASNPYASRSSASGWQGSAPNNNNNPWSNTNNPTSYTFYSANWLNWSQTEGLTSMKRIDIVKNVASQLADSLNNVNLGLMRYSSSNQGGMVTRAVQNISTDRQAIKDEVNSYDADGYTPLSETYYEAARYFKGASVDYGNSSTPVHSAAAARVGGLTTSNTYKSPIEFQCQKNYIVYLTDGLPTQDHDANATKVPGLIGHSCDAPDAPSSSGWTTGSGRCADDIAEYLFSTDISPLPGTQTVSTYTIGFGSTVASGTGFLDAMAQAGGTGSSRTALDVPSLTVTLQEIFSDIQQTSATFVTPAVSVNAFNRTQIQNDLYFNVFRASLGLHWPGNLKKYKLATGGNPRIVDADGNTAVDGTGFFAEGTRSIWSATPDGADVTKGGAANRLDSTLTRPLYTNLGLLATSTGSFVQLNKSVALTNLALTDKVVGAGASTLLCSLQCQNAIRFARGEDVDDDDSDLNVLEQRFTMGDPLHGKPAVVTYGGSASTPDENDTVVFMPTNDGVLHAVNGKSDTSVAAGGGKELWAFIPKELLYRLTPLYQNADTANRSYGLDGDIQVLRLDRNNNGIIEAANNDRVWLFFGMRMGQDEDGKSYYYALDVTDRTDPKVMWVIGPDQLPGLGQTWSPPVVTRVNVGVNGASNNDPDRFVLIFGGGYDLAAENPTNTAESVGNRIFMVDAKNGALLWYAGNSASAAHLKHAKMTNAFPARINVVDLDGDSFADRMYAGDLGGRVWRFDIFNGGIPGNVTTPLVTGGVLAQFGFGNVSGATAADNRRFYNMPDVTFIQRRNTDPFFNIAIGSGYRGHPLDASVTDRFYSLRDRQPFSRLTQAQYDALVPVLDSQMTDVTADPAAASVPTTAPGWKFSMTGNGSGEKVLSDATTVNNVILFTSFQPLAAGVGDPCFPANINRAYALSVGGRPALDFNNDGTVNNEDVSTDLHQSGIAGEISVSMLNSNQHDDDDDDDDDNNNDDDNTLCRSGTQILSRCPKADDAVRTFWQRDAT